MNVVGFEPRRLRVATYNVHGCVGADGRRDVDRVAEVVAALDADLIGLQEVDGRTKRLDGQTQLDRLAEAAGMQAVDGPTIHFSDGSFGNAMLARHPVDDIARWDVSVPRREPRGVLDVRVVVNGSPLRVLTTHFGLKARERGRQVDVLLSRGEAKEGEPLVILGDFNEWRPRAAPLLRLHEAFGRLPPVRSFPARFPVLALDRIWVHPKGAVIDVERFDLAEARWASDHLPVIATIETALLFGFR